MCIGNMQPRRERLLPLLLLAGALVACSKAPLPQSHDPQYQAGWQAGYAQGRHDERAQLCGLALRHQITIESTLGHARLLLLKSFCA
jgi:hypothetical protein